MKIKNTSDTITLRGVEFAKGKAVDLTENPSLFQKVSVLDGFKVVKAKANDKDID